MHPPRLAMLEPSARRPVVRRSMLTTIQPADTIAAIDGRAIEDVYEEELARTSGRIYETVWIVPCSRRKDLADCSTCGAAGATEPCAS